MKKIPLTQGKVTFVDDQDYAELSKHKWYARKMGRSFYASRQITETKKVQKTLLMHRVILNLSKGTIADHIDRNGLNNRRSNLRVCSRSQNGINTSIVTGVSHFKGVCWNKKNKNWRANIRVNYKQITLGSFDSEEDAARAYNKAALLHFGEFAYLNPIPGGN